MGLIYWFLLSLTALFAGCLCYSLVGQGNTPTVIVAGLMGAGVIWFYLKDWELDSYPHEEASHSGVDRNRAR